MIKRILLAAAAGLVLAGAGAQAAQPANDEAAIRQVELSWVSAVSTGDRATLDRIIDDSYIEMDVNGRRRTKADVMSAAPPAAGSSQTLTDFDVHVNGDTAVVLGINQFRQTASDNPQSFTYMDVLVRRDGAWRVTASQMTRH